MAENLAVELIGKLAKKFPTQKQIASLFADLTVKEKDSFLIYLQAFQQEYGMNIDDMVTSYSMFVQDTLEESKFFYENDRYRYSTYQEVADYMASKKENYMQFYQVGLLSALFIWPTHVVIRRHFTDTFSKLSGKKYLEVGFGHGYYFKMAIESADFLSYLGVDISEDSFNMTTAILKLSNYRQSKKLYTYSLELSNFLEMKTTKKYDAIVSGEVLEHVEHPELFLKKIAELSHRDTFIYMTVPINAPEIDHIYLFRSPDELEKMFSGCGLEIAELKLVLYREKSLETCLRKKLPVIAAIIAKKASK